MASRVSLPIQVALNRKWLPWLFVGLVVSVSLLYVSGSNGPSTPMRQQLSSVVLKSFSPFVHCPSPHDVDYRPLDRTHQRCSPIASTHPEFSLEICHDPSICNAFTVKIARTEPTACRQAERTRDPSDDPELNMWLRRTRGPDAFVIKTDGAQRYTSTWSTYEGDCEYSFDVRLKNAGPVYLRVWHTFKDYEAFSETNHSWPEQLWVPLTANAIKMNICPSSCTPVTSDLLLPNNRLTFYPPDVHDFARKDFPDCTGDHPIPGSYLPLNPLDVLYPPFGVPTGARQKPIVNRYKFVPESCNFRHSGLRFGDPKPCVSSKKKIMVWGDSHGRVVHDSIVHRLKGEKEILFVSDKGGYKVARIGNVNTECMWDPMGLEWTARFRPNDQCEDLVDLDAFALSLGHHHAGQGTTAEYLQNLTTIFTNIASCLIQPKRKIFLAPPAQPPRQDTWIKKYKDHRTNVRLHYWADLSTKLALEFGWAVVNQYALTIHHHEEVLAIDMAHYLGSDAIDPIVDEVIEKMGICPRIPDAPDTALLEALP